jgi:3',5'-cyclic AMP phosphodiesterase CpdA
VSRRRSLAAALICTLAAAGVAVVTAAQGRTAASAAVTLLAAGDIAACDSDGAEQTAALARTLPGRIAVLGDIAYPRGSAADFRNCFDPSWGALVPRFLAVALGNHEYYTGSASAAVARLTLPRNGWSSTTYGGWHVVVLNSNCSAVGGCGAGSPQWRWLRADLARHPARCTLALWHHPRYSSGLHGSNAATQPLWALLARAKAEIVLSGHDHDYERFAPVQGIRQFVVGTGGASVYPILVTRRGSQAHATGVFGLLRLTLRPAGYSWRFVPVAGSSYSDSGSAACR